MLSVLQCERMRSLRSVWMKPICKEDRVRITSHNVYVKWRTLNEKTVEIFWLAHLNICFDSARQQDDSEPPMLLTSFIHSNSSVVSDTSNDLDGTFCAFSFFFWKYFRYYEQSYSWKRLNFLVSVWLSNTLITILTCFYRQIKTIMYVVFNKIGFFS